MSYDAQALASSGWSNLDSTNAYEDNSGVASGLNNGFEVQLERTARVADFLARDADMLGHELHSLQASLHGARHHESGYQLMDQGMASPSMAAQASLADKPVAFSQLDQSWLAEQEKFAAELKEVETVGAPRTLLPETTALLALGQSPAPPKTAAAIAAPVAPAPAEVAAEEPASGTVDTAPAAPPAEPADPTEPAEQPTADQAPEQQDTAEEMVASSVEGDESALKSKAKDAKAAVMDGLDDFADSWGKQDVNVTHSPIMAVYTWGYRFTPFWSAIHWTVILVLLLCFCWCCYLCGSRSRPSPPAAMMGPVAASQTGGRPGTGR